MLSWLHKSYTCGDDTFYPLILVICVHDAEALSPYFWLVVVLDTAFHWRGEGGELVVVSVLDVCGGLGASLQP